MNNVHLDILGSNPFVSILNELEFNNILNSSEQLNQSDKNILVKILFVDSLKVKDVKNYLLQNKPTILFLNYKDYIKKNNLKLLNFHVSLELPIEVLSFKEIINILINKYRFFKKSKPGTNWLKSKPGVWLMRHILAGGPSPMDCPMPRAYPKPKAALLASARGRALALWPLSLSACVPHRLRRLCRDRGSFL